MSCRETAAVFNFSSSAKLLIYGPEARQALQWICTADIDKPTNSFVFDKPIRIYCASIDRFHIPLYRVVYSCALNNKGGVESDFTVTVLDVGNGNVTSQVNLYLNKHSNNLVSYL